MMFSCPGRLYAKSLIESGAPQKDYDEWFAHQGILAFRDVLDSFDLELRSGPVIVVVSLPPDRNLLFRYSWCATSDQNGRRHERREAFLVDANQCRAMLAGRFTTVPDADLMTFSVETSTEDAVGEVLVDRVCGYEIKVFARQRGDFELIKKQKQPHLDREENVPLQMTRKNQGENAMFKFLSVLLACGCLVGGWYYWTTNNEIRRLESELSQTKKGLKLSQGRIAELQRWEETRQNFERNVSNMREIFSALKKSVAEAESLLTNIDGVSNSSRRGVSQRVMHDKDDALRKSGGATNATEGVQGPAPSSQDKKENKRGP